MNIKIKKKSIIILMTIKLISSFMSSFFISLFVLFFLSYKIQIIITKNMWQGNRAVVAWALSVIYQTRLGKVLSGQ